MSVKRIFAFCGVLLVAASSFAQFSFNEEEYKKESRNENYTILSLGFNFAPEGTHTGDDYCHTRGFSGGISLQALSGINITKGLFADFGLDFGIMSRCDNLEWHDEYDDYWYNDYYNRSAHSDGLSVKLHALIGVSYKIYLTDKISISPATKFRIGADIATGDDMFYYEEYDGAPSYGTRFSFGWDWGCRFRFGRFNLSYDYTIGLVNHEGAHIVGLGYVF